MWREVPPKSPKPAGRMPARGMGILTMWFAWHGLPARVSDIGWKPMPRNAGRMPALPAAGASFATPFVFERANHPERAAGDGD